MPIRPENKARYPHDWALRRRFIIDYRSGGKCEWCGVPNYAVGQRIEGRFKPVIGNRYRDQMQYAQTYSEARELADHLNEWNDEDQRFIVIVLTIAHVYDDQPESASLLNLAALCQRCHNRHDAAARRRRRRERRQSISPNFGLF